MDRNTGKFLKIFDGWAYRLFTSVCFYPDGTLVLLGCADKSINLWGLITRKLLKGFYGLTDSVASVCFSLRTH
jgi:WD40 repeat protein